MTTEMTEDELKQHLWRVKRGLQPSDHPVNQMTYEEADLGERLADKIAAGIGSWRFLIIQTIAVCSWVALNIVGFIYRWDPYPFILLNLLFSVQAAYTGPVLLLAGNRQTQKDRLTLEHAASEADKADKQNTDILTRIAENTELTVQILRHLEAQREELLRRVEVGEVHIVEGPRREPKEPS
jgi:uncharacterized membrane protein